MIAENSEHLRRSSYRYAVLAGVAVHSARGAWPRVGVAAAIAACIGMGIATSIGLRSLGLSAMWLRYPLALAAAYTTFLVLSGLLATRLARRLAARQHEVRREVLRQQSRCEATDAPQLDEILDEFFDIAHNSCDRGNDPHGLPAWLLFLLAATVVLICVYYVCMAPLLIAELALEGGLMTWLYRPAFRGAAASCLTATLEQSGAAAMVLALSFMLAGAGLQIYAPRATTLEEVRQVAVLRAQQARDRAPGRHANRAAVWPR